MAKHELHLSSFTEMDTFHSSRESRKIPAALVKGAHGMQRTIIYYCNPMLSWQKGGLEQAHTLLRMVLLSKEPVLNY